MYSNNCDNFLENDPYTLIRPIYTLREKRTKESSLTYWCCDRIKRYRENEVLNECWKIKITNL